MSDECHQKNLYSPEFEHDACGIGAVVSIDGKKSYSIVSDALSIVEKLEHRAGKDGTGETGDGVGILLQISHKFFSSLKLNLGNERDYGVGMFFFPQNSLQRRQSQKMFEVICAKEGTEFICWRDVPVNSEILGAKAKNSMPYICQCFVKRPDNCPQGLSFDRKLYVIRRVFEQSNDNTYVCSLSSRTIVYKGMFLVHQLRRFYSDLQNQNYESAIAMVHSRFSTNTTPSWERAHPNRLILHNGEINTIRGNCDRMLAREETMHSDCMEEDMDKILPAININGSDSAMLDNTLEFLMMNGIDLPLAVMITIPEPWKNNPAMSRSKRDLYRYYSTMIEPWDGPAAIFFSDGDIVGAVLDRNGLRPARYYITKDRRLILSSEVGVLQIPPQDIVLKQRLQPGKMLLIDTVNKNIISDGECKEYYASRKPYGEWLDSSLISLSDLSVPNKKVSMYSKEERARLYKAFGYTYEDINDAILPMAKNGCEPTASMGTDIPLAVLSENHQPLFNYFKQLFAQVTNPPLDALREEIITDTTVYIGSDGNLLSEKAENCRVLQVNNPILTSVDLMKIRNIQKDGFKVKTVSLLYYKNTSLEKAVDRLFVECDRAYREQASRVEGIGLEEINEGVEWRHNLAFDPLGLGLDLTLESAGAHNLRSGKNAEDHLYSPEIIIALREATQTGSYSRFKEYTALVDKADKPHTLRGLIDFKWDENGGISINEVESVNEIVKRFKTGAMSYGSISEEAHTCLAVAMNTLGGKSNSGEGGEDPSRFNTIKNSAIKQVASGRFGVTSAYLCSANEIQIKTAQGAKPGEGGHLPGKKVYPWIAKTRCSTPGVSLISPPPHHDIYSIEDLAQLIFDLKCANRDASISVKLVSVAGVGTVAAGVAKAGAEVVLISGYDGGTGAAPKSSIYHAGLPWELGLAEAHQTLILNGLRSKVRLETDGKLMSGRDVAIACILGAEEFGFATAPLISMGCVMMRVCNLDTCPAGIATQNPELRCRFCGKPEYVMNFMRFIAQELREIMAKLGVRTMDELVGRTDKIMPRKKRITHRADTIDLTALMSNMPPEHYREQDKYNFELNKTIDEAVLLPEFEPYFAKGIPHACDINISSTNRTLGTILGSVITRRFSDRLQNDTYTVNCNGGGGQSFGAFIPKGLTLNLTGDANDYFGKGLSGGKLIVKPDKAAEFAAKDNIIIGNVALYGATGGTAFINGIAGERFCVRNSGATAVAEGCGDHGCEYMTGGVAVILGVTGKNFAAGMSGGIAYVLDEKHDLYLRLNKQMVSMSLITERHDANELYKLISAHVEATDSGFGKNILQHFEQYLPDFKKIVPNDYQKMMITIGTLEEKGVPHEQAKLDAFYLMQKS